jgi:hypothetical protein
MSDRIAAEMAILRTVFPDAELHADGQTVRIPAYPLDRSIWGLTSCEVAFAIALPGQPPYAFRVRPGLSLITGAQIQNYSYPVTTAFGSDWGQFSWSPEIWTAADDAKMGSVLSWARSFADRLAEGA